MSFREYDVTSPRRRCPVRGNDHKAVVAANYGTLTRMRPREFQRDTIMYRDTIFTVALARNPPRPSRSKREGNGLGMIRGATSANGITLIAMIIRIIALNEL